MRKIILSMIFIACMNVAQSQSRNPGNVSVFYDEDYTLEWFGLRHLNEDRNYTLGLGISWAESSMSNWKIVFATHYFLNHLNRKYAVRRGDKPWQARALMFSNGSFTPDDLRSKLVIGDDRPYSTLTFLQSILTDIDPIKFRMHTSTFTLGMIGTDIGKWAQSGIHSGMNNHNTQSPWNPEGWPHQISWKGEPTAAYTDATDYLITKKQARDGAGRGGVELKWGWRYSLGYYTNANAQLSMRIGRIDRRNWTYMVNPLGGSDKQTGTSPVINPSFAGNENYTKHLNERRKWELYSFGSIRPRIVAYNALLNGQLRCSDFVLNSAEMKHVILEFDGGGAANFVFGKQATKTVEIKIRFSGRSPEFEIAPRPKRWHYWMGIDLVHCWF